ncbi:MAG: hypothetical protein LBQ60_13505 [Bacteroidales bacterium]|nr:hypothetical protein [Bacteroidales bacterium]
MLFTQFHSCDTIDYQTTNENTIQIVIRNTGSPSTRAHGSGSDDLDHVVNRIRILAFDPGTGQCASNVRYMASVGDVIYHKIRGGIYNFVFLANEPNLTAIANALENVSNYSDLAGISLPESVFSQTSLIPFIQQIDNLQVLGDGSGAIIDGGTVVSVILLALQHMGVRVDVTLEATENLDNLFTGVTFSTIPDVVPLSPSTEVTSRKTIRKFTVAENAGMFSSPALTQEQTDRGIVWVKQVTRVILPSNIFTPFSDKSKATVMTVNLLDKYNPSCELRGGDDDYTLPYDRALLCVGVVKMPLELNIQTTPWNEEYYNWGLPVRILNVSRFNADITDFNGARITFISNMPVVRVLPTAYQGASGTQTIRTNLVFNSLADETENNYRNPVPERLYYSYDASTGLGTGYMDLLGDGAEEDSRSMDLSGTYRIILSAENTDRSNALQREITVNISQSGTRFMDYGEDSGVGYNGAFFRNDQTGERIITMQNTINRYEDWEGSYQNYLTEWSAEIIEGGDFIVLSSTPSFDPAVGTDNPGNAEDYPVTPNTYKGETGKKVTGKGRIYFRIGTTGKNTGSPRYGVVRISWLRYAWTDVTTDIYVRQGEEADYIYSPSEQIAEGILSGQYRTNAKAFSPYNLTADVGNSYTKVQNQDGYRAKFTEYPTQAGAFFQWGTIDRLPYINRTDGNGQWFYKAYTPVASYSPASVVKTFWENNIYVWQNWSADWVSVAQAQRKFGWTTPGTSEEPVQTFVRENYYEVSPDGYRRPTDGDTENYLNARNGPYPNMVINNGSENVNYGGQPATRVDYSSQISGSEWRVSLFKTPRGGSGTNHYNENPYTANDGDLVSNPPVNVTATVITEKTYPDIHENWEFGFYADGFFDRRPINRNLLGVSVNNAYAAFRGNLFYHPDNNKSVFFPAPGRRNLEDGTIQYTGGSGYYWSSTPAPPSSVDVFDGIWGIEMRHFCYPMPYAQAYGLSIRPVKIINP